MRLPESREVILEYIVERKTLDDLASSVIDKRFHEQKVSIFAEVYILLLSNMYHYQFRMKHSGIRYPVYLVEEGADISHCGISEDALQQAIINTQVYMC